MYGLLSFRRNELYHHGIEGQKWGVRNGPPYPLERRNRKISKKLKNEDFILKKNTGASRYTDTKNEIENNRRYVSLTNVSEKTWDEGFQRLMEFNGWDYIYKNQYLLKKDLKVASIDTNVDYFYKWLNEGGRERFDKIKSEIFEYGYEQTGDIENDFFKALPDATAYDYKKTETNKFLEYMKKNGYDAIADKWGIETGADLSVIILNPNDALKQISQNVEFANWYKDMVKNK